MIEWFVERQVRVLAILAVPSVLLTLAVRDERWPVVIAISLVSLVPIGLSQRLYSADTTENWLSIRFGDLFKNIVSGFLCLIGWSMFLRGGLALAIGAAILWLG